MDLDVHLEGIVAGDEIAFSRWLAGAEPHVRGSLRAFAAEVDTEAVLQEALLRTWQVAPRLKRDGGPNSLLRLCVRIGQNLAVDEVRQVGRLDRLDAGELDRALASVEAFRNQEAPDPLLRRTIEDCHKRLPGKPAEALAARLGSAGTEPDQTLADRLGMRLNTFLQNFTRARKMLADCLQGRGVDLQAVLR